METQELDFLLAVDVKYLTFSCRGMQGMIRAESQKSL